MRIIFSDVRWVADDDVKIIVGNVIEPVALDECNVIGLMLFAV